MYDILENDGHSSEELQKDSSGVISNFIDVADPADSVLRLLEKLLIS